MAHPWPGNVRELESVIERSLILSPGSTLRLDEAFSLAAHAPGSRRDTQCLDRVAREHILAVLDRSGWKIDGQGHAAEKLGPHPNTLPSRMKKLGIRRPPPPG